MDVKGGRHMVLLRYNLSTCLEGLDETMRGFEDNWSLDQEYVSGSTEY